MLLLSSGDLRNRMQATTEIGDALPNPVMVRKSHLARTSIVYIFMSWKYFDEIFIILCYSYVVLVCYYSLRCCYHLQ